MDCIQALPVDTLENRIFAYLDGESLYRLSLTSKALRNRLYPIQNLLDLKIPPSKQFPTLYLNKLKLTGPLLYIITPMNRGNYGQAIENKLMTTEEYQAHFSIPDCGPFYVATFNLPDTETTFKLNTIKWKYAAIDLTMEGFVSLNKYLPPAAEIHVHVKNTKVVSEFLKSNTKLVTKMTFHSRIGGSGGPLNIPSAMTANIPNLTSLVFDLHLTLDLMMKLAPLFLNISELSLHKAAIGPFGLEVMLDYIGNLKVLNLAGNELDTSSAILLAARLPDLQLHHLDLSNNLIMDKGVQAIANVLPGTTIETLDINFNSGFNDSLDISPLFEVIHQTKLTEFVYKTAAPTSVQKVLLRNIQKSSIRKLEMMFALELLPEVFTALANSKVVELVFKMEMDDRSVSLLGSQLNYLPLKSLCLRDCSLTDHQIKLFFSKLGKSTLQKLDISENRISEPGFNAILKYLPCTNIKSLTIGEVGHAEKEHAARFLQNVDIPHIKFIGYSKKCIGERGDIWVEYDHVNDSSNCINT
ncbi:hypothetical protein HDV01_003964 [Terramyces sp. JEL0728]|nr:hypothetical protein HDV01_003964 [Terramyces sp. JEL0728]